MSLDDETTLNRPTPLPGRVVLLATRAANREHDLLVLQTSDPAQLPTAPIGPAQTPADCARRLAEHLLGRHAAGNHRRVAVVRQTLPSSVRVLTRTCLLRTGPSHEATPLSFVLEPGTRVRVGEWQDEFVHVVYEEFAYQRDNLGIVTRRAGWLLADALAGHVAYHLFHLHLQPAPTPPHPTVVWLPLSHVTHLHPTHQRWLDRARPRLGHPL